MLGNNQDQILLSECVQQLKSSSLYLGGQEQFQKDVLIKERNIGIGRFCTMHGGIFVSNNNKIVVKEFNINSRLEDFVRELQNLEKISKSYPFIIKCEGFYFWTYSNQFQEIFLVSLILQQAKTDVQKLLLDGKIFEELELEIMLEQLLYALRFMNQQLGTIDFVIRPENILVMEDGTYRLSDFLMSQHLECINQTVGINDCQQDEQQFEAEKLYYLAPEAKNLYTILQDQQYHNKNINVLLPIEKEKITVFSLGISILQLLFGLTKEQLRNLTDENGQDLRNRYLLKTKRQILKETLEGMLKQDKTVRLNINQSISCIIQSFGLQEHKKYEQIDIQNKSLQQDLLQKNNQLQIEIEKNQQFAIKINQLEQQIEKYQQSNEQNNNIILHQLDQLSDFRLQIQMMQHELDNVIYSKYNIDRNTQKQDQPQQSRNYGYAQSQQQNNSDQNSLKKRIQQQDGRLKAILLAKSNGFFSNIFSNQPLQSHDQAIQAVAFSHDSKMLASGSWDCTVKLWDMQNKKEISTLKGHRHYIKAVAFDQDCKMLASSSFDCTVKLWDVRSKSEITTFIGHLNFVNSVAFSADSKMLASGSNDKNIRLWDLQNKVCITTLRGHSNYVLSVIFLPDCETLVSGGTDNTIKFWDIKSKTEITTLKGHSQSVWQVAYSPVSQILASASLDKTIKLWDIKSKTEIATLKGHSNYVYSVSFSPDSKILASSSNDQTVKLWDLESKTEITTLKDHSSTVWTVSFSQDSKMLASASGDNNILLYCF